jgi:hypothetical protein
MAFEIKGKAALVTGGTEVGNLPAKRVNST